MTKTGDNKRAEVLEELNDLGLDAAELQELVAAERINREARQPGHVVEVDDATTIVDISTEPTSARQAGRGSANASSQLINAQAQLVKDFVDSDTKETATLMRQYQNFHAAERPCFLICTSAPKPRLRILHGFDIFPSHLGAPTKCDDIPYVFHGDSFDAGPPPTYELSKSWFRQESASVTTLTKFEEEIKKSPDALISAGSTKF